MAATSMQAIVTDALASVRRDCPEAHRAMTRALGDRQVQVRVDHELFTIRLNQSGTIRSSAVIELHSTARALYDVLRGDLDALAAILSDEIVMKGDADDLVATGDAGLHLTKGALRCAARDSLLERLKHLAETKKG
jgi:hypothetical protein